MSHIRDETKVKILAEIKPPLWLHVTKLAAFCFVLFSRSFCIKRTNKKERRAIVMCFLCTQANASIAIKVIPYKSHGELFYKTCGVADVVHVVLFMIQH